MVKMMATLPPHFEATAVQTLRGLGLVDDAEALITRLALSYGRSPRAFDNLYRLLHLLDAESSHI